jgi:hypothetical protein
MVLPTLLVVIDRTMDTTGEIAERFSVEVCAYVLMDRKLKAELINAFLQTESLFR